MEQKLITLCPISLINARKKPNFSKWVRLQLINEEHKQEELDDLVYEVTHLKEACKNWCVRYYDVLEKHQINPAEGFEKVEE